MDFYHLHVHHQYSQLDGYGTVDQYASRAAELGFGALAMTDHGNIDGAFKWQKGCEKHGVKPITGCELYVVPDASVKAKEKRGHMTVLVKGEQGWRTLLHLLSHANVYGFYNKPRVDHKAILEADPNGLRELVFMTGCASTFLGKPGGGELFGKMVGMGLDVWLEVMPHDIEVQKPINELCARLSRDTGVRLVASNDCHYVLPEQAKVQEVLLAVQRNNAKWSDPKRFKFGFDGIHLRTADEMAAAFEKQGVLTKRQYMLAIMNTAKIAEQCWDFRVPVYGMSLPKTKYENSVSDLAADDALAYLCRLGWGVRFPGGVTEEYNERYDYELGIIKDKGFARYFLLVYGIIEFCKENDIPVGPGRGSAAGSLLCYLLGITGVDPVEHGLLFERFINPARPDWPDIDLDFPPEKTGMIRQYLEEEYGQYNVAGISTFQTMRSRGAVRDVGRVFELPFRDVDAFAKSVPDHVEGGGGIIATVGKTSPQGKRFKSKYPEEFKLMCALEGQVRNSGQHPAGIIVSGEDLRHGHRGNLCLRKKNLVVNWDMGGCEKAGLNKLDILKLTTLSVLQGCVAAVKKNHDGAKDLDLEKLTLDDPKVFEVLAGGNTVGVFQMAGYACTKLAREMKIDSFNDMAACVALARPGPLESKMAEKYVRRKHGEKWEPMHPLYEAVTAETYGVMAYQEQMMRAVVDLAGLSRADAEHIRKVIGKKRDPKEFEPHRVAFLEGCKRQKTLTKNEAQRFWDDLLGWASYGFNRCLTGDTEVEKIRGAGKKYLTIKEAYELFNKDFHYTHEFYQRGRRVRSNGLRILSYIEDSGRFVFSKVKGVFYNGKKIVLSITTKKGLKIKCTGNHRLLTTTGYKFVCDISIGDQLLIKQKREVLSPPPMPFGLNMKGKKYKKGKNLLRGKDNPGFINGKYSYYGRVGDFVWGRAKGRCEMCNSQKNLEISHTKPLDFFNGNYEKYHSKENVRLLCKKHHRKFDFSKGEYLSPDKNYINSLAVENDTITNICTFGVEDVFDVEMEGPNHNFVANGIVSHNSHAVVYALLAYWTAWLKVHYPVEFLCSTLTWGDDDEKQELVNEAQRMGLKVVTPKVGKSLPTRWHAKDGMLYAPFTEISGVGPAQAEKLAASKPTKLQGFFKQKGTAAPQIKGKLREVLESVCAFDPDPDACPLNCLEHFNFDTGGGEMPPVVVEKRKMVIKPQVVGCEKCLLRAQADRVVPSSTGIYNALILGEAPGDDENKKGMGWVGAAGKRLWEELAQYNITRRMVHVGNCVKCWPSQTQTPTVGQVDECMKLWGWGEIKSMDCRLILACGNIPLGAINGTRGGIRKLSGEIEWVPGVGAWVVWCVHPSSVLRNAPQNEEPFKRGIETFANAFKGAI